MTLWTTTFFLHEHFSVPSPYPLHPFLISLPQRRHRARWEAEGSTGSSGFCFPKAKPMQESRVWGRGRGLEDIRGRAGEEIALRGLLGAVQECWALSDEGAKLSWIVPEEETHRPWMSSMVPDKWQMHDHMTPGLGPFGAGTVLWIEYGVLPKFTWKS